MGFFDQIVQAIDKLEDGVNKTVDTLEMAADKPGQLLDKAAGKTGQAAPAGERAVDSDAPDAAESNA